MFVESYGRVAVQGSSFSPGVDAVLDARTQQLAGRRLRGPERLAHVADLRRHQLARALDPAVGALGEQPAALRRARARPTASRSARRSSGPAGGPSATCRPTTGPGRRARRSTATTSSTTGATSAIAARSTRTPPCPTSTSSRPCSGSSSRGPTAPVFAEIDLVSSHTPWTPHPAADRLERPRRRLGLPPAAGRRDRAGSGDRKAGGTASRSSTPSRPHLLRPALRRRRTSCSSCSATTNPRPSSPATTRATTCRSRSSPTTRR